jgi:hypothetical protein
MIMRDQLTLIKYLNNKFTEMLNKPAGWDREEIYDSLKQYGIYWKRHPEYPKLVQFRYDQFESYPFRHMEIVKECRGIILEEGAYNWNVVCLPFTRFFNLGEDCAAELDPKTLRVQEKVDGSLLTCFNYEGEWLVCTTNSPNAAGSVMDLPITFADLFWRTFDNMGFHMSQLKDHLVYMFELTTPLNMVVVSHTENKLTLLAQRGVHTLVEVTHLDPNLNPVKEYPLNSIQNVVDACEKLNPLEQEGYVIIDGNNNRVKVKSPKYVALHHLVSEFSVRNCLRLIKLGEASELFAYYPHYKEKYETVNKKLDDFIRSLHVDYILLKTNVEDKYGPDYTQKQLAEIVTKHKYSGILFTVFSGKHKNVHHAVMSKDVKVLEEYIK